jgi:Na+-driven multidrug efflux pump
MGLASVLMLLFIHPIAEFFTQEPVVVGYAVQCLRIFAAAFVAWGLAWPSSRPSMAPVIP